MSSGQATALGVLGAMLTFFIAGASASDVHISPLIILLLGTAGAGVSAALGYLNPGTSSTALHTAARQAEIKEAKP